MPPLPDPDPIIRSPSMTPAAHPQMPSPTRDGLRLEVLSGKEYTYRGHVFGVDTPYWVEPSGWGEWFPSTDL